MRIFLQRFSLVHTVLIILFLVACIMVVSSRGSESIAHAAPSGCRVVLALDNSRSVGNNWDAYRAQVSSLFSSPELRSINGLKLAFWTFSDIEDGTNFNRYSYGYVAVDGSDFSGQSEFLSKLNNRTPLDGGYTNYAQGFGYNADGAPPFTMVANNNVDIRSIAQDATVLGLITDGAPNHPSGSAVALDGNDIAIAAAYKATRQYPQGTKFFAGFINSDPTFDPTPILSRSINDSPTPPNPTNVGPVQVNSNTSGTWLSDFLIRQIINGCKDTPTPRDYSLVPKVTVDSSEVTGTNDTTPLHLGIDNSSTYTSDTTDWQLFRLLVPKDKSINNLVNYGSPPYRDGGSCNWLRQQAGDSTSSLKCDPISLPVGTPTSGTVAPSGMKFEGPGAFIPDGEPEGTRACYFLMLTKPTQNSTPTNRYSQGVCIAIKSKPPTDPAFVQIRGGDLRVGRSIGGYSNSAAQVSSTPLFLGGNTFGSWVQYGILAPGKIENTASASGYKMPIPGSALLRAKCPATVPEQEALVRLTFGNTVSDCGKYDSISSVPDFSRLKDMKPSKDIGGDPFNIASSGAEVLYRNTDSGNMDLNGGTLTTKGKTIIVYVPNKTVTILNDIKIKVTGGYDKIEDIPQVIIIANNIIIKGGVSQIDAWLIASGSEGNITTCDYIYKPTQDYYTGNLSKSVCNNSGDPLTINGPVMAKHLYLRRTAGAGSSGKPGEIINLSGTSYLWEYYWSHYYDGDGGVKLQTTFTKELPPYF